MSLAVVLLIVALILFLLATFSAPHQVRLIAGGLAALTLAQLLGSHIITK